MTASAPRVPPLADAECTEEQQTLLAAFVHNGEVPNLYRVLARHPAGLRAFWAWGGYILGWAVDPLLGKSTLQRRERELLILRIAWLCRSEYEWIAHVRIGLTANLTPEDIERVKMGSSAPGWTDDDRALVRAAEELRADQSLSDEVWAQLAARWSQRQCMDIVFVVAQYVQVSMILKVFGVPLEEGLALDESVKRAWGR